MSSGAQLPHVYTAPRLRESRQSPAQEAAGRERGERNGATFVILDTIDGNEGPNNDAGVVDVFKSK